MKNTEKNQDLLKVFKLNQNLCSKTCSDVQKINIESEKKIIESDETIEKFEKLLGIKSKKTVNTDNSEDKNIKFQMPAPSSWNELVIQANQLYPETVSINDLLTKEEYFNALKNLDDIESEFSRRTKLNKLDIKFLIIAIVLQCVRQYVVDPYLKGKRENAGVNDEKGRKNNAEPGWYRVETDKILISRVPFDSQGYSNNSTVKSFLKGGGHRSVTLGHDPALGWIFGTANILTNTITRYDFQSAHIKNIEGKGNTIHSLADTTRIFNECKNRLLHEGMDGKVAVGSAIVREAIHLKSDVNTKKSLPLPVISTISPSAAEKLCRYGIDTASVGSEMSLSIIINTLISSVHRLFYDEKVDDCKLYAVRTRKILLYSNCIASTSNIIASYLLKNPGMLDVGGLIVTIIRLFSDIRFIARIKQEYIESQLNLQYNGIVEEIEKMNQAYFCVN